MDDEKRQAFRAGALGLLKEVAIAALAVAILMGGLYAYSGVWPPMVVVESGSMQHSDTKSSFGLIDTGDMVFVKSASRHQGITTYIDGRENNLWSYGGYGHVIVYRPYGNFSKVPIIHRAVAWVEVNETLAQPLPGGGADYNNYTFDVPILGAPGMGIREFVIADYGYAPMNLIIDLRPVLRYHEYMGTVPHDGFVTAGDHNIVKYHGGYDQLQPTICADLVDESWVIGVAFGEIPWFGLLKLMVSGGAGDDVPANSWQMLGLSVFLLLAIPFCVDMLAPKAKKWWVARQGGPRGSKRAGETEPAAKDAASKEPDAAGHGGEKEPPKE